MKTIQASDIVRIGRRGIRKSSTATCTSVRRSKPYSEVCRATDGEYRHAEQDGQREREHYASDETESRDVSLGVDRGTCFVVDESR